MQLPEIFRSKTILFTLVFAILVVIGVDQYLRYVERQALPDQAELIVQNDELFDRVAEFAQLKREIKDEYLRCRNLISEESNTPDPVALEYCFEFVDWASALDSNVF